MGYRIDPKLAIEVASYGAGSINKCFNCGNCTAVCALSKGDNVFPRKFIRYLQLGLRDKLLESPEPWLCYYCGNCSVTCPREAEPGEIMMSTRRWLTGQYDPTGLAKKIYQSARWEVGSLLFTGLVIVSLFILPGIFGIHFGFRNLPIEAKTHVHLGIFANVDWVHYGDWVLAASVGILLLANVLRMLFYVFRGEEKVKVPISLWFTKSYEFVLHFLTQKRWLECDTGTGWRWLQHFLMVAGYGIMFYLVVIFLPSFQLDSAKQFNWTGVLGYFSFVMLLGATTLAFRSRWQKKEQVHKFSHSTDWIFLFLLFMTALTGIVLNVFRLLDLPMPTYVTYVIHLVFAVCWSSRIPFGKWTHAVFRPLSKYIVAVLDAAKQRQDQKLALNNSKPIAA